MTALLWAIGAILATQLVVLAGNILFWVRRKLPEECAVDISILIPARDELHNLPTLLDMLSKQTYRPREVVICDDQSTDGMAEWLGESAGRYDAEWFVSAPCPEGWTGKNWACSELAGRATGDWLVFLDADVRPEPEFLQRISSWCGASSADLVTALPRIRPTGIGDGLLIGMVPWAVFSMLPLRFAELHRNPAFAFANGQVMAYSRETYGNLQPHSEVRRAILDDVQVARLVKREGGKVAIADMTDVLSVEMYRSLPDALNGFAKNSVAICGGTLRAVVCLALLALVHVLPLALAITGIHPRAWALAGASALLYGVSVRMLRLPWWYGFLYPAAMVLGGCAVTKSLVWHLRRKVHWKGRVYENL